MEKNVTNIVKGETLLVGAKAVNGGKIQLEFAEIIINPYAKSSNKAGGLTKMLNKSDSRFNTKSRKAWVTGEPADISELLGIDVTGLALGGPDLELNILNPEIGGERVRVQITETITPNDYQAERIEATAKKAGADGDYILHNGQHMWSNTDAVTEAPEHTFLKPDGYEDSAPTALLNATAKSVGELAV